jgi:pyruvate-formate lyase-activating enzyme
MLTTLHIILTHNCALRCKHCYVYSSPKATGKISLRQISNLLFECRKLPAIERIYFDGGEPFTQYPLLLKAIHKARARGFEVSVGTNGYFARTVEAGIRFLRPLAEMGVKEICISNDPLHYLYPKSSPAKRALQAAQILGMRTILSRIAEPGVLNEKDIGSCLATELKDPRLMYAGRAAESLVEGLPTYRWQTFTECPRNDLSDPE